LDGPELRELLKFLEDSPFVELEIEREGFRLKVRKPDGTAAVPTSHAAAQLLGHAPAASAGPAAARAAVAPAVEASPGAAATGLVDVTSPMVGTFYRAASPEAPPFVEIGSPVRKGQVLCIVEAMKLMNEIESEAEGELVEILAANAQPVEYGEVLFRIRPTG
jgi:acetyl-CoA carboxylase biotin carboxyl carrier protein